MYKNITALVVCMLLCAGCREEEQRTVIKFQPVKRLPNSLEYYDKEFTKEEINILAALFKKRGVQYYIDVDNNIYVDGETYFGESAQTYFWGITDALQDSLYAQWQSKNDTE